MFLLFVGGSLFGNGGVKVSYETVTTSAEDEFLAEIYLENDVS